ncbi:MAG: PhzF family phenazine biosynthesis protein [Candidatus Sericytochromatia bacterium]
MSEYAYWIVDVFTAERFGGNQLAVIPQAEGLTGEQMQAIAREFNYSETTFVLPPEDPTHTASFRIFTPARELPFAGHPTVGTAWVLGQERQLALPADLALEAGVGLLRVRLEAYQATFQVARQPEFGELDVTRTELADLLGLVPADLGPAEPVSSSCGLAFALVELKGLESIARARLTRSLSDPIFEKWPVLKDLYMYSFETVDPGVDLHTRMFAPGAGVAEDPATGSAASALAAWLAHQQAREGEFAWTIEQGLEMGRPSRISTRVVKSGGKQDVFVSGQVVPFSQGRLRI